MDVTELKLQLEKAVGVSDSGRCADLLQLLLQQNVTAEVVQSTRVGMVVGKLRKHSAASVATVAKQLVKKWKNLPGVKKATTPKAHVSPAKSKQPKPKPTSTPKSTPTPTQPTPQLESPAEREHAPGTMSASMSYALGGLPSQLRNRVQKLLCESIEKGADGSATAAAIRAGVQLEQAMFEELGEAKEYKEKYRSLVANFRDANNTRINELALANYFPPLELVRMKESDLASEELRRSRESNDAFHKAAARSDLNKTLGMTDLFRCGKCKQRKCTYYQLQTRGADEPMTTFVTCTNCANRWKC